MKHRNVVADDGRLAHHDARPVVNEHPLPELGGGVDVYLELLVDLSVCSKEGGVWRRLKTAIEHTKVCILLCCPLRGAEVDRWSSTDVPEYAPAQP